MVAKTLLAGVPMVVVPGGGDQWEIANRVVRQGSGDWSGRSPVRR